jgi:hypothetical protein
VRPRRRPSPPGSPRRTRCGPNCGRDRDSSAAHPRRARPSAAPQERAPTRAYQIATASFYAGQWDAARDALPRPSPPIARRRGSRGASTSPAARCCARGTMALPAAPSIRAALATLPRPFWQGRLGRGSSPLRASATGLVRSSICAGVPDALRPDVTASCSRRCRRVVQRRSG